LKEETIAAIFGDQQEKPTYIGTEEEAMLISCKLSLLITPHPWTLTSFSESRSLVRGSRRSLTQGKLHVQFDEGE